MYRSTIQISIDSWLRSASPTQKLAFRDYLTRLSPAGFATTASRGRWQIAPHLDLLNRKLVEVAEGRIARLLISLPPRHGKSNLVSTYFPPWYLGRFPDRRVILAAYESEFAASWGRKSRDVFIEQAPRLYGLTVNPAAARADNWQVQGHPGGMMTAGVGGPLTGYGADLLIFDDPIKNSEQAASPTYRDRTWEWWQSTAYTRLEPGGAVVGIMTRWHPDDLIGRILKQSEERWETINLPALAEEGDILGRRPGEPLWPSRFDAETLKTIRASVGSYYFSALYQGRPTSREGGFFKNNWFRTAENLPGPTPGETPESSGGFSRVRGWDLAATEDGDYTVGVLVARKGSTFFVEDVVRGRWTPAERDRVIVRTATRDGASVRQWFEQEPGSAGVTVAASLKTLLQGYPVRSERSTGSKTTRADALAGQVEAGNVVFLDRPWYADLHEEFLAFPNGKHDDQVDALSLAFNKLVARRSIVCY